MSETDKLLELSRKIQAVLPLCPPETKEIFNELWSRMEVAETYLEAFELRLKGNWTKDSKLYTQEEVNVLLLNMYE